VKKEPFSLKRLLRTLGPGFISGASDDDPTAIAAYTQAGARFGYSMLWTALFTFPFMTAIQEICGRIGMVTGKGLAGVIKQHFDRKVLYGAVLLLIASNTINIGADLGAMAASAQMLFHLPFAALLIIVTAMTLVMEIFISYRVYAKFLKFFALSLLTYVIVAFVVRQDWGQIALATFIPTISWNTVFLMNIIAILGSNISPYLFFWQAGEEVEEEVSHHRIRAMGRGVPKVNPRDFRVLRMDTMVGMLFSNLIVFFICVTAASTLGVHGITDIQTPQQAAEALIPFAGQFAFLLFAIGIIGSGFLAVPVLASSASYALAETFNWKEGLYKNFKQAHGFYGVITIATLIGLLINFTPIKPFQMLIYAATFNAVLAPPLLVIILLIANNKRIMGVHTNSVTSNIFAYIITVIMSLGALALLWQLA
jgi:NRAMP (natural resistance-associated macrophage protein)-like metal ion transporter